MNSISVVLPTYNEAENITPMLKALLELGVRNKYELQVHVIDDNSPDGTAELVQSVAKQHKNVHLVRGQKQGLGKAYIRGFDHVLSGHAPDVLIMMDCDFSHDPLAIPLLVDAVAAGHDYVIGSRYASGGAIPGDWPLKRIVNSKVANLVATNVGGIDRSIKDISGGFKAIRAEVLREVRYQDINTFGYGFQMHLLHLFIEAGHSIHEIPIVFRERKYGSSKMRLSDILGFLKCAYGLNPNSSFKKLLRFATVGGVGILINLLVLFILQTYTLMPSLASSAIAVEISIASNFLLHSKYTFRSQKTASRRTAAKHFFQYNTASVGTAVLTVSLFALFSQGFGVHYLLAQLFAICVSFFANYWISDNLIWRKHANR